MNIKNKILNFFSSKEDDVVQHNLNREILREYDIRGIIDHSLFPEDAYNIGKAFGAIMYKSNLHDLCVGWDCRKSSNVLSQNLVKGLVQSGMKVISLGVCHTPMMYYTVHKMNLHGGIMVTGSHNPPKYNGFKLLKGTNSFYGKNIQLLGDIIENKDFIDANGREIIMNKIINNYITDLLQDIVISDNLKVVWDIGNGATSHVIKSITSLMPGIHHLLFEEMDGNFPNRSPDPTTSENIIYLRRFVQENNFDIGFAFDSDGDRLAVVNHNGQMLYSDQVMEVFATDFLQKNPGAQVIADVKSCNRLFDIIKKNDGIPIMEKVGHSFIKDKMNSSGALLAGEMSGHFFFKDRWFGFDDGIYSALRCLEIISKNRDAFIDLEYGYITPEIRIKCHEHDKFGIIDSVKNSLLQNKIDFCDIDGVRVESNKGWWLLRASNTQNAISLRIESNIMEDMPIIKNEIATYLSKHIHNIETILNENNR